ncbi:MAG: M24 family metallopeptidase [Candidatus Bathycorpusculaceae bacterium]
MLIKEKVEQAIRILNEYSVDCWLTFVRESGMNHDPMLDFLTESDVTWHSAFIITKSGETYAIVGQMDRKAIEDLGIYTHVFSYVEGIKGQLITTLKEINPSSIAINYSKTSEISDGLTHGMYLTLLEFLSETGFEKRLVSAERVTSSLRARKTDSEQRLIKKAVNAANDILKSAVSFIMPGRTEKEIAAFLKEEVKKRNLALGWDENYCPSVFTGPETAEAHYKPTDREVEKGHLLNIDFGVKYEGYCSDLQRTFYVLQDGETEAPPEIQKGFKTIATAIELARQALKPGVKGCEIDAVARNHVVSQGYEEFPHALGHQVGLFAHDGTALLGPPWEKYAEKVFEPIEEGMVFTIEPRLKIIKRGIVSIEEMVIVRKDGAEFLSEAQEELILIGQRQ